jgi:hypothetical protein
MKRILLIAGFLFALCATASPQFNGCSAGFCAPNGGTSTAFSITAQTPPAAQTTAASSFTFTSTSIGTASTTRIIAVAVTHGINAVTISSLTVGGNNAIQATGAAQGGSTPAVSTDIWYYADAGALGTSATIVVNFSGSESRCAIAVFTVAGTGAAFSVANGTSSSVSITSISTPATNVPSGGGAIVVWGVHQTGITGFTPTSWTVDNAVTAFGSNTTVSGHTTSASGSTTFGASWTTSSPGTSISVATFSP